MNVDDQILGKMARRLGHRLAAALDARAYPLKLAERSKALGATLGIDPAVASGFISGHVLPDYIQLAGLCEALERQPGYFFDEHASDIPPGTTLVKPLGPGEDLVIRLPAAEVSPHNARRGLIYCRAKMAMGFGIQAGEYLIAFQPSPNVVAERAKLYLFSTDEGLAVRKCVEVGPGRAVFHTEASDEVPLMVSTAAKGQVPKDFSQIVARMRFDDSMRARA